MNHCVPDFDIDDYYSPSSGTSKQNNMQDEAMMELVWHNGQLGMQNQSQRFFRKSPPPSKSQQNNHQEHQQHHLPPSHPISQHPPPPESDSTSHLFMQEDEMTSWLNYPADDASIGQDIADLLYHPPPPSSASAGAQPLPDLRPPPAPQPHRHHINRQNTETPSPSPPPTIRVNFPQFARLGATSHVSRALTRSRNNETTESTVVDSSVTPTTNPNSFFSPVAGRRELEVSGGGAQGCEAISRDAEACEVTVTSSAGCSGASAIVTPPVDLITLPPTGDRKRKGRESADDATTESQSEDLDLESSEANRRSRRSVSAKRPRQADVHNLSERRRRDKINEKMKALQELIPRCTKTDKASMLDEAIDYMKSLQMQLQMMSMGYGMVPVMFPGAHQYMTPMGMGMRMGMNGPMMPFSSTLAGSSMPTARPPSHFLPTFPMPPVPPPPIPSRTQPSNHTEWTFDSQGPPGSTAARFPVSADPYQHYIGGQQMPSQTTPQEQPNCSSKTSTGGESGN